MRLSRYLKGEGTLLLVKQDLMQVGFAERPLPGRVERSAGAPNAFGPCWACTRKTSQIATGFHPHMASPVMSMNRVPHSAIAWPIK